MEIHVNNQTAGVITYVDGNQVVYGGLHGSVVTDDDAWRAVGDLREALTSVPLDGSREAEARARTTAGAALMGPLQTLASWLGAHGAVILGMLAL